MSFNRYPSLGPPGPAGPAGANGAPGVGVPAGGTTDQVLSKVDATNYNTQWVDIDKVTFLLDWNPSTNTPSLVDGIGTVGDLYRVSVADTINLGSGYVSYNVNDYIMYNGTIWTRPIIASGGETGSPNTFAGYDGSGVQFSIPGWMFDPANFDGLYVLETVVPESDNFTKKLHGFYTSYNPVVTDSEENWFSLWIESKIGSDNSGNQLGDYTTGQGGLTGLGIASDSSSLSNFGYIRSIEASVLVGNGTDPVLGNNIYAFSPSINISNACSVQDINGVYLFVGVQPGGTVGSVTPFTATGGIDDMTGNYTGFNLAPAINFSGAGTKFYGVFMSPSVTGVENAAGLFINMSGVSASGNNRAIEVIGDTNLTGIFQSSVTQPLVDTGGNAAPLNFVNTDFTAAAGSTTTNVDRFGFGSVTSLQMGAGATATSSGFGLGIAAMGIIDLLILDTGASIDNVDGSVVAMLTPSGDGHIDNIFCYRAVAGSFGGTTTIDNVYGFSFSLPFGNPATNSWAFYDSAAQYNWLKNSLKIGGSAGTTDRSIYGLEVEGSALFNGDLGFYNTTPIPQPASSGPQTAGATYTATEQTMLQEVYDAVRALGLMT